MSANKQQFEDLSESVEHTEEIGTSRSLMDLFDKMTLKEWWGRVKHGLKEPKETGEYKWARGQLMRLSAPVAAVLVPLLLVLLLMLLGLVVPETRTTDVTIMEPETIEELEEIEEIEEIVEEIPEPEEVEVTDEAAVADNNITAPDAPFSPQPTELDTVAIVKSPVIFPGIIGSRNPGARGSLLGQNGGNGNTEAAVLRALRWLKKNQNQDGSWDKVKPAMTSLALLTFLAHGETPASEEFGYTVEAAIRWLVDHQEGDGGFQGRDGHDYTHPIAAYALSEAFAMTKVPMVKTAAEKALNRLIQGQHPSGGWDYNLKQTDRDDTSYMGWCAQALKAGYLAKMEVPGLDAAKNKSVDGFRKNYKAGNDYSGTFGYTGPGNTGLTSVGVLCLQLLGAAKGPEATGGLKALEHATFNWANEGVYNKNYFWYYTTQAKFHAGGATWNSWNKIFSPVLVNHQTVIPKNISGYVDHKGEPKDIGWWDMGQEISGHTDGDVMNTCLCALQLQVYYRYLPTFMTPKESELAKEFTGDPDEIEIF
ncbi:MAG: terpene cyclase/mutase family protein [Verrucomicrobia bacterium]|nr:terpene cyclase/mutase family protein [Verrucomicrobiota bacterium]